MMLIKMNIDLKGEWRMNTKVPQTTKTQLVQPKHIKSFIDTHDTPKNNNIVHYIHDELLSLEFE